MKQRLFFTILFVSFAGSLAFFVRFSFADVREVEEAVLRGDYRLAKKTSEELLKLDREPQSADFLSYYLALSSLRLGEHSQAQNIFQKLLDLDIKPPLRDKIYLGLFDAQYAQGNYDEAQETGESLLRLSPDSPYLSTLYFKLAKVHLKLTHWRTARNFLRKIERQFPASLEMPAARQLLEEKQYFAVQVGAFMDRAYAEKQAAELRRQGEYAYVVETVDAQKRKFFRVRVGQLTRLDEAQRLKSKLADAGYPTEIFP